MRKSGETHKQYISRLESALQSSQNSNRALRILNAEQNKTNPRTGRTYEEEARELFITVALVESALRDANNDMGYVLLNGQLTALGFDDVQICEEKCLLDGAYDGKK